MTVIVVPTSEDNSDGPSPSPANRILLTPAERRWPQRQFSILDNVLGPDGHGPSSSHTIAPQKIALEAFELLGGVPDRARVFMFNSFATTGAGHRTDVAITAGLLGLKPTDPRTRVATTLAHSVGLSIGFEPVHDAREHPNTLIFNLTRGLVHVEMKAISIGGGNYDVIGRSRLQAAA